jgi:hypothetical protein
MYRIHAALLSQGLDTSYRKGGQFELGKSGQFELAITEGLAGFAAGEISGHPGNPPGTGMQGGRGGGNIVCGVGIKNRLPI